MSALAYVAQIRKKDIQTQQTRLGMKNSHCLFTEPNLPRWLTTPISLAAFQVSAQQTNTEHKFQYSVY